ncbi:hypothetical protein NX059_001982 [Plenodomus lindquistii]|nr:hypothetical protein NX059_001982 [Plenodomus lindquistii]
MESKGEYAASWLQLEEALGSRFVLDGSTADELRAQFGGLTPLIASQMPPPSDAVNVSEHQLEHFRVRTYRAKNASNGDLPIGVYAHGGGFVLGDIDAVDPLCRTLAEHTPAVYISVNYRLSPEHKAPTHLNDMIAAVQWAHENASLFKGNASKIFTMGDSAGGTLALAVTRKTILAQTSLPPDVIKGILALVPATFHPEHVPEKYQSDYKAYSENTNVPMINQKSMETFFNLSGIDKTNAEYFIGMDSLMLAALPPTYIATCEFDPLRDDGIVLAKALREAGAKVKEEYYAGLPHAFWYVPSLPETAQFMQNLFQGVQWVLGQMRG